MQTQFHWQLLWKQQPSVAPPKEENGQETAFHYFISALINCMPMISALTVPVEMHKKNTVLGKMYMCDPRPQAALTNQVRFYAFQKFSYLNQATGFWLLPIAIAEQESTHTAAEGREGWVNSAAYSCWNGLEKVLITWRYHSHSVVLLPSATPHICKQSKFCLPISPIVVCTMIGIFQISFLLFFKDIFYYFCWSESKERNISANQTRSSVN